MPAATPLLARYIAASVMTLVLSASVAQAEPLLVLQVQRSDQPTQAALLRDVLTQAFAESTPERVVSLADLELQVEFERVKSALGCADDSQRCAILAARKMDFGRIAGAEVHRLGRAYVCTVKVVDTSDERTTRRSEARTDDEAELPLALRTAVLDLVGHKPAPSLTGPVVLGGVGAAVLGAGLVLGATTVSTARTNPMAPGLGARAAGADVAMFAGGAILIGASGWLIGRLVADED